MIPLGVEVFVATESVDMRYGFERLGGIVRERMRREPRSKNGNRCTDPTSTARPGYAAVAAGTAGTVIGPIGNSSSFGSSPARVARQRFGARSMYLSRGQ